MTAKQPELHVELSEFLAELASRGVRLSAHEGALRCQAPHGALSAEARALLSARKPEILAFLAAAKPLDAADVLAQVGTTPPGTPAPLSFAQQRLWIQAQLDNDSTAYNMRMALRIEGRLVPEALQQAIDDLVSRHHVLRTIFATEADSAVQIVVEDGRAPMTTIDLRGAEDPRQQLEEIMADATRVPFDLGRAPLLRVTLAQLGDQDHVLCLTLHHLVGDGASLTVIAAELRELYAAAIEDRPANLPKLPLQYIDYSRWQRQEFGDERLESLRMSWVEALKDAPPLLSLPTDQPRTRTPSRQGAEESFVLSPVLSKQLRQLARSHSTTLFTTMLAGFSVLMARYSNQDDLVIGCPVSNRSLPELETLVGMFVNSLPIRVQLDGNPTFRELIERVHEVATTAYANQELPFDQIVEAVQPPRDSTHHPIFQVMFIHDNASPELPEFGGLRFELLEHERFDAKFDLMFSIAEANEGIRCKWEYRRDLFDAETIRRACSHLCEVLTAMVSDPGQRVMQAPLLTADERSQMLTQWSRGPTSPADRRSLLERFREHVERAPNLEAVRHLDASLTYADLDLRVNQLAVQLLDLGVSPGQTVAVMLPRCVDMVAALLAVHAAGCTFVPLDPRHPSARLAFMIEDSCARAVVTTSALAGQMSALPAATLRVDIDEAPATARPTTVPPVPCGIAYSMYTSGSTGSPKAVLVTQAGLSNYLTWSNQAYGMRAGACAVVATSVAFDATITTLFGPLVAGGTVLLLPEEDQNQALADILQFSEDVDLLKLTPAHIDGLRALLGDAPRPGHVTTIVVGGEQLLGEHVRWCQTIAPRARVVNEYGPTETVVGCCTYELSPGAPPPVVVPIGRPIANTQLYVLDPWLEPVPIGVAGELYIGGAGVAKGYHQQAELTNQRFVHDPFSTDSAARLYRTGDRVAYLPDGSLRFIGRIDAQVKIRGHRVELGEVEVALGRCPSVDRAVAIICEATGGREQLVAYVVSADGSASPDLLRERLSEWLPEHMIPSLFVDLPELPLTANGKVDRSALPKPELAAAPTLAEPRRASEVELELAALWASVLGRDEVGLDDNFFELGGDSILGIQLVARARGRGLKFAPRHIFEHQTVAALAKVVKREGPDRTVRRRADSGPIPLAPVQAWFFEQDQPNEHHFNHSIMLELPPAWDAQALEGALQTIIDHHDALRSRFKRKDGSIAVEVAARELVKLMQIDLTGLEADERATALAGVTAKAQTQLDLERGPLFAPTVVWMGDDESDRLLLTAHHLVVDGVSWRLLVEDLIQAYVALAAGMKPQLPAKTAAHVDWARALAGWASSEALTEQLDYWTAICEADAAELSIDHPDADEALLVAHAEQLRQVLDGDQTEALASHARAMFGADIQAVLLTALVSSLAQPGCGLRVDLESHGREDLFADIDISRTVGWFASLYPQLFTADDSGTPHLTLEHVTRVLQATPDRGVGYMVMRYAGPDALRARLAAAPQAQVAFNYLGHIDAAQDTRAGFGLADEDLTGIRCETGRRLYALELSAAIQSGELCLTWTYCSRMFERSTMESIAARFLDALAQLAASTAEENYTPADFPDVDLSQDDLDHLITDLDFAS